MLQSGYKVVKVLGGCYFSPHVPVNCVGYTEYKVNEFVSPQKNCGPLAVWENREAAERYIKREQMKGVMIFPCQYEPSDARKLWVDSRAPLAHTLQSPDPVDYRDMDFADRVKILPQGVERSNGQ